MSSPVQTQPSTSASAARELNFTYTSGTGPTKPPRQRRWAAKTRTGCRTCRARHVKCDETKPECKKCQRLGRSCGGWSAVALPPSGRIVQIQVAIHQPAYGVAPIGVDPDQQQLMAFDTLQSRTALEIAGCFDRLFWTVDMLRATRVYPAVWHAGLAMATVHHRMKITASPGTENYTDHNAQSKYYYAQALAYYNSSITSLLKMVGQENPAQADQEAILLVCLIFTGLCTIMGTINDAITHARNGLILFYQWQYWMMANKSSRQNCLLTADSLVIAYTHLESQFVTRIDYVDRPRWRDSGKPFQCSIAPFSSLTDAYFELQTLMTGIMEESRKHTVPGTTHPDMARNRPEYKYQFNVWTRKFEALQRDLNSHADNEEGLLILQINATSFGIIMDFDIEGSALAFDRHWPAFEKTISLAEKLYEHRARAGRLQGYGALQYSFSLSTCEVLDFVGRACRDPFLRRRLITLLRNWPHLEGIWDSKLITTCIEAIFVVEEAGVEDNAETGFSCACVRGSFICDDHRVCSQDIEFLPNGRVKATLNTIGNMKQGRPATVVMLR